MLTAKGFELSLEELREQLGILKVIHKPFSPRDLLQQIDQVCKGTVPSEQLVTNSRYQL